MGDEFHLYLFHNSCLYAMKLINNHINRMMKYAYYSYSL